MSRDELTHHVAAQIAAASGGTVQAADAVQFKGTLIELGLTSLGYLRLLDALETEFGVYFDLEDGFDHINSVAGLVKYITQQGVTING